ncbi:MAG: hypothetical protein CBB65_00175 [Hyphomonadaceae bacterium TMED5]|nr:hypothetical protein [Ponticaulis sp.]OUY01571.1 MAG: hypothetical protein CBB65_00175 [Hyphomonadaceae bacterium TMED5]
MTVIERVAELLEKVRPDTLCDDCIATKLKITPRQHANHKTRELAKSPHFQRIKAECSSCGSLKLVSSRK